MKNNPLVSVIMPIFNGEQFIKTSVESILNQTYKNFEFIIVNDGSSDNTKILLNKYAKKDKRIVILTNKNNKGVTFSLNKGLGQARGKYVVRMDVDDWSYPNRLTAQTKYMESHPDVVICGSFITVCDDKLKTQYIRKYHSKDIEIKKRMFRYSPFAHPATIWRADIMEKEKYDESEAVKIGEDYDLYFRVGLHGKFANIQKPLLKLRMHNKSISFRMNNRQSRATIRIRYNAVNKYGYKMSFFDKIYNYLQLQGIGLIPISLRFKIFNFLRQFDFY